ncbi:MAG: TIGR03118 family protein [Acidobacteriota bacterium]|nr:TIGR03118 family protein [Acidobacteriota bacterium]
MRFPIRVATAVLALTAGPLSTMAQPNGANSYIQINLVSNTKGNAAVTDPNLIDPWGIAISTASPFWLSNHLSGTSTLYNGAGTIVPIVVTIPPGSASPSGSLGRPTGQVQNNLSASSPAPFLLPAPNGKAAAFIFDTDDGTISAWNNGVSASTAVITVDNSASKAVYKGLAIGSSSVGPTLYAANFRSGTIEAYDGKWAPAALTGNFSNSGIPSGFAPFNIWNLDGKLYVTYAKQDSDKFLDVAGPGNGYVAVFDTDGNLLSNLIFENPFDSLRPLNSPWGLAIAPAHWGAFGGALLVGNFGDGKINAFNAATGAYMGPLQDASGNPIVNPGLWALIFGNGKSGGDANTLYIAAGEPNGSSAPRGLIAAIAPPLSISSVVNAASGLAGNVAPGEIVLINGQSVGPSPSVTSAIAGKTSLPTTAGANTPVNTTTVTFNGTAAPIVYAGSAGTSVQVPYEVAGSSTASIALTVGSQTTMLSAPVAATAPGLFTLNFSGTGEVVALNSDGTVNSSSNPAARGSSIMLFATGEGVTNPMDMDGVIETTDVRIPVAAIAVSIGGTSATVASNSSFPKDVAGVLEVVVTVPSGISAGAVPVSLSAGGVATTQATTLYVK